VSEKILPAESSHVPDFGLQGAVALVTGAAGHLGAEMSLALAASGAHVILNGRSADKLEALAHRMTAEGLAASVSAFDITDAAQVDAAIEAIRAEHGKLDVLVNNAYAGRTGTIDTIQPEDFMSTYDVAVAAAYGLVKSSRHLLAEGAKKRRGGASVINIASMYGVVSPDPRVYAEPRLSNPPHYGAAKGALLQLTRYLACHMAGVPVRVNAISPGPFPRTPASPAEEAFVERLSAKVPLGRVGAPNEIAGAVVFLASEASSFVTGANLPVDGGWTAW
jgi:NAD(P)-dependent dehydrogenase (short-subunit alcohol dehydrogenase family)